MSKVIILNAPPGAGKDTIGRLLAQNYDGVHLHSFKQPMFDIAAIILGGAKYESFLRLYNNRKTKEIKSPILGNLSPREFMIWISEDVIKPRFGKAYFGERMVESILSRPDHETAVITDGGFPEETLALVGAGFEVLVCRLHRRGYGFGGDSRNYLHMPEVIEPFVYDEADLYLQDNDPMQTVRQINGLTL